MVLKNLKNIVSDISRKYKYVLLIVAVGILLMLLPTNTTSKAVKQTPVAEECTEASIEDKLSSFLSLIDGAGKVQVILTVAEGEETIYQTNEKISTGENTQTSQADTVTITGADRGVTGLVKQVNPKVYLGAVVVCTGGDNPEIRLSIVDAVSKLTGLGANQISVLKMK